MHYETLFFTVVFVLILAITSTEIVFGYADDDVEILVSTDKSSYKVGDLLNIKGTGAHSYTVFAHIISPNGDQIADLKLIAAKSGDFSTVWIIPRGLDDGTYSIQIKDVKKQTQTTFDIGNIAKLKNSSQNQDVNMKIPDWIKQVAEFWFNDQIDDAGFVQVIEYLVQQNIITIPYAEAPEGNAAASIPIWIKTNAEFWVQGNISDDEFAIGLEWLINNGIIRVQDVKERVVTTYEIEDNFYPIYQFTMTPSSPDCPDYHLHTTFGYTVDSIRVSFTDHNPSGCGLGMADNLIQHHLTITEKQIFEWEKVTGIIIPEE